MIPIGDDPPPRRTFPIVTLTLIAVNIVVFLFELTVSNTDTLFRSAGVTPLEFATGRDIPPPAPYNSFYLTLLTSMFLHGGFLHIGSNMLFLWIFGDNVEDRMGHGRYLVFYLLAGVLGNLAQVLAMPDSTVPLIGASGAIAGVMGAYLVLFPRSRILVLIFLLFYINIIEVSAVFFLAFWFLMQLLSGAGQLANMSGASVGFFAHIGGFLTGALGVAVFKRRDREAVEWWGA